MGPEFRILFFPKLQSNQFTPSFTVFEYISYFGQDTVTKISGYEFISFDTHSQKRSMP